MAMRRDRREAAERLAALERDIARAEDEARAHRWRGAELLGRVRREPDQDRGIGGLGFVLGVGLVLFGLYAFFSNVIVTSGFLGLFGAGMAGGFGWGRSSFGPTLLLLLGGIALTVLRPRAVWGWGIAALAVGFIFFDILGTLRLFFRPVSLPGLIIMLLPLGLGLGLILKSVVSSLRR